MKKLVTLLLGVLILVSFSGCSWSNSSNTTNENTNDGPSAVGPQSLPDLRGPLKPPSE